MKRYLVNTVTPLRFTYGRRVEQFVRAVGELLGKRSLPDVMMNANEIQKAGMRLTIVQSISTPSCKVRSWTCTSLAPATKPRILDCRNEHPIIVSVVLLTELKLASWTELSHLARKVFFQSSNPTPIWAKYFRCTIRYEGKEFFYVIKYDKESTAHTKLLQNLEPCA